MKFESNLLAERTNFSKTFDIQRVLYEISKAFGANSEMNIHLFKVLHWFEIHNFTNLWFYFRNAQGVLWQEIASQAQMYVKEQSDEVDERALILTQGVLDDIS